MTPGEEQPEEALSDRFIQFEQAIIRDFETYQAGADSISVPLELWQPDGGPFWMQIYGRWRKRLIGQRHVQLREGVMPGESKGRRERTGLGLRVHARRWAEHFSAIGMTPSTIAAQFQILSRRVACRTYFQSTKFCIVAAVADGTGRADALTAHRLRLADQVVEALWMNVMPQAQRGGLARKVMIAIMDLYSLWPVWKVEMRAGLSSGGAVWGGFGFRPTEKEWNAVRRTILERIPEIRSALVESPDTQVLQDALTKAEWHAATTNPRALWRIRDIRIPCEFRGHNRSLGEHLLQGTRWKGFFDFGDRAAVKRLKVTLESTGLPCAGLEKLARAAGGWEE